MVNKPIVAGPGTDFRYRPRLTSGGRTRNVVIPLPVVGHWMKQGWGRYARAVKLGRIPRVPGL